MQEQINKNLNFLGVTSCFEDLVCNVGRIVRGEPFVRK